MLRKIVAGLIISALVLPVLFQVAQAKVHEHEIGNHDSPITSPITAPITSPITSPISFFNLTGEVTYHHLGRLLDKTKRFFDAENVLITVKNFWNPSQKYNTTTDSDGMYSFNLPSGLYWVSASDNMHTFFVPPSKVVSIKNNKVSHADFQGLIFP